MVFPIYRELIDLVKHHEGCHRVGRDGLIYPYHDPVGYPTQGYGHLLSREKWADLSQWEPWTPEYTEAKLVNDLMSRLLQMSQYIRRPMTPAQIGALLSFTFNVGIGNFRASTLLRVANRGPEAYEEGEWEAEIRRQFSRWKFSSGRVLPGLIRRREDEANLFFSG